MLANSLTYYQKVSLLTLIEAEKNGLSHEEALKVARRTTGISNYYLPILFVQLASTHRMADNELYYWDRKELYLITRDTNSIIGEEYLAECGPMRREIIRQVRKSFSR